MLITVQVRIKWIVDVTSHKKLNGYAQILHIQLL